MTTQLPPTSDHQRSAVGLGWRHPHYGELLQRQPPLSFLEVHSENFFGAGGAALSVLEQGRAHYPVSLHGVGLSLGSAAGLDPWHLDQLARLVKHIDPVRVSDHASFARGTFKGGTVHASDLLPIPFSAEALSVLCTNVQQVQDRLQRRFLVENLSSYLSWRPDPDEPALPEPDFLSALAQRTGCGLLIDVNNIYVNALNDQINGAQGDPVQQCLGWLDRICPVDVGEIHLAGHSRVQPMPGEEALGEIVIDDHGSRVCPEVWQIYAHAIARFGAVPTLIEWDTDIPALDVLLAEAAQAQAVLTASVEVAA
jgi:uncharacterized protein (UPF0276 family)